MLLINANALAVIQLPITIDEDMIITQNNSPYIVEKGLTINKDATLIINKGVELILRDQSDIFVFGSIRCDGSEEQPIVISRDNSYNVPGMINMISPSDSCIFKNVIFDDFKLYGLHAYVSVDSCYMINEKVIEGERSCIWVDSGYAKITSSFFSCDSASAMQNTGEGIFLGYSSGSISNCEFHYIPDAVEISYSQDVVVTNNQFYYSADDAIDLNSSTNALIENNEIYFSKDKGISIGYNKALPASNIKVYKNLIVGTKSGVTIKDYSNILFYNNTLYNNQVSLELRKSYANTYNNIIIPYESTKAVILDSLSQIDINYSLCNNVEFEGNGNIQADPLFINPEKLNFRLMPNSPAINAGDPGSMKDPDSSRADIGYYYYNLSDMSIIINEINYNSPDNPDAGDWIELYNPNSQIVDLSGWYINEDNSQRFIIPSGTFLDSQSYLVVCKDSSKFKSVHWGYVDLLGGPDFELNNNSCRINLYNHADSLIDFVDYFNFAPWPEAPDGQGATLELINPGYDNTLPESWAASQAYGSPGAKNSRYSDSVGSTVTEFEFVNLYPNPATENLKVECKVPDNVNIEIEIYDVYGNKLNPTIYTMDLQNGLIKYTINMREYAIGVYYLSLKAAGREILKPFVIMR